MINVNQLTVLHLWGYVKYHAFGVIKFDSPNFKCSSLKVFTYFSFHDEKSQASHFQNMLYKLLCFKLLSEIIFQINLEIGGHLRY
jgi:hypothetical protein